MDDFSWLVALIEGEGSFHIHFQRTRIYKRHYLRGFPAFAISLKDEDGPALRKVSEILASFGVKSRIRHRSTKNPKWSGSTTIAVSYWLEARKLRDILSHVQWRFPSKAKAFALWSKAIDLIERNSKDFGKYRRVKWSDELLLELMRLRESGMNGKGAIRRYHSLRSWSIPN